MRKCFDVFIAFAAVLRIIAVKWEIFCLGQHLSICINSLKLLVLIKCEKKEIYKRRRGRRREVSDMSNIIMHNRKWKIITLVEIKIKLISH